MRSKAETLDRIAEVLGAAPRVGAISYWIVVKRGKKELRTILETAFRDRRAFTVIEDRRSAPRRRRKDERRESLERLRLQDFVVAERREF